MDKILCHFSSIMSEQRFTPTYKIPNSAIHYVHEIPMLHIFVTNVRNEYMLSRINTHLLPSGSEEREVSGVGSIPVAILSSCQYKNKYSTDNNV